MRSPPHIQSTRQNSFRRDAAVDAILHRLPDYLDPGANTLFCRLFCSAAFFAPQTRAFICEHNLVYREPMRLRGFKQLRRTMKRVRDLHFRLACRQSLRPVLDNEPSANREESSFVQHISCCIHRAQTKSVGMLCARTRRKHDCSLKDQVLCLIELNRTFSRELQLPRRSDRGYSRFNRCRVNRSRFIPGQAQQHGAICSVPHPGQRKRPIQLHLHAVSLLKFAVRLEFSCKAAGRAHRSHGVRTRWANTDFIKIEETRGHAQDCSLIEEWQAFC